MGFKYSMQANLKDSTLPRFSLEKKWGGCAILPPQTPKTQPQLRALTCQLVDPGARVVLQGAEGGTADGIALKENLV